MDSILSASVRKLARWAPHGILRHRSVWTAFCFVAGLFLGDSYGQQPIVTNQDTFFVPFSVPQAALESVPKLVELHVSGDQGKTWSLYQKRSPQEGRFSFRAGVDGEFWFAIRAIDAVGKPHEQAIARPELVVIVDRQQPSIELAVSRTLDGKVAAQWRATDGHLAEGSLSLAYRVGDESPWQDIEIPPAPPGQGIQAGQTSWAVPQPDRVVEIQATVRDQAGNTTVASRQVPPLAERVAAAKPQVAEIPLPAPLETPIPAGGNPTATSHAPRAEAASSGSTEPRPPIANVERSSEGWMENPHVANQGAPPTATTTPTMNKPHRFPAPWPGEAESGQPQPPVGGPDSAASSDAPCAMRTAGETLMSSSRRFHLDYDVESSRPDDVYRVEVWHTDNGGRTWRHLGDDEDRVSPYLVNVPEDGTYGFRLIVQGKEGFAARPPRTGDPADVWVQVDATKPSVRITSAKYGRGNYAGMLQITWEAHDGLLDDQPVTLLYGENPSGPWRKIAGPLPNTGQFDWQADDRVPEKIYLRIEAIDRAGNVGENTLLEPINASGLAPRARIHAIRPASGLSE